MVEANCSEIRPRLCRSSALRSAWQGKTMCLAPKSYESGGCHLRAKSLSGTTQRRGTPMVPDFIPLYAVVIVLFSLIYFAMASIPFLFVRLDVPEVSRLFRGLFDVYFWMVGGTALLATAAFAASGRLAYAAGMLLLAVTAMA